MKGKMQDQFLVAAALSGDEEAFGKLYDKYVDDIFRFVSFRVRNQAEAEDLSADVFLKAWQYLSGGSRGIENFKALLYRIARNVVIDHYRKSGRELLSIDESQWETLVDTSLNIEEHQQIKDDLRLVREAIEELLPDHRELILMRYADDLTIEEIAGISGKSKGAVRVTLHRAVKALKEIFKKRFG